MKATDRQRQHRRNAKAARRRARAGRRTSHGGGSGRQTGLKSDRMPPGDDVMREAFRRLFGRRS